MQLKASLQAREFENVWPKVLFPFQFIASSYLVITVAGHHIIPSQQPSVSVNSQQMNSATCQYIFFYDGYLKMTKIINLPGLSLRVYIEFVDETTSQLSWRGTAGFEEAKGFW